MIKHSFYYNFDEFKSLVYSSPNSFSILSSNIQSINAKYDELYTYIEQLKSINFKYSIICLQESWTSDNDDLSLFQLDGYTCLSQGRHCSNKGGLLIYVDSKFSYELKMNLNTYENWEGLVVKIHGGSLSKAIYICNLYRPPRVNTELLQQFINDLSPIINNLNRHRHNIVIAGDFNINLLEINDKVKVECPTVWSTQRQIRPFLHMH